MELWIRSQDKKLLYKPSNLEVYDGGNKSNNRFFIKDCGDYLGGYETEKRALEVLDEIEKRIMLINTISIARDTDSLLACQKVLGGEKIQGLSYPYQMPEE